MNYEQLRGALRDLVARPDLTDSQLAAALRMGHQHLQRTYNWRCMEASVPGLAASADGVEVAEEYKEARAVWLVDAAGGRQRLNVTSETSANLMSAAEQAGLYPPQWYERGQKLAVIGAVGAGELITVDYYYYLPFYDVEQGDATDWFSRVIPDVLLMAAAYWLSKVALEDERANHFLQVYESLAKAAQASDRKSKAGGQQGSWSPPLPGTRVARGGVGVGGPSRVWSPATPAPTTKTGTVEIADDAVSAVVGVPGLTAEGLVVLTQLTSTGGLVNATVAIHPAGDSFTVTVPAAPGAGLSYRWNWGAWL